MEEYLRILLEQIRCKKARPMIEKEIRNHILDQAECYESQGMEKEQALQKAATDMGDPVETGIALDHIHRPQTDWHMLLLVGGISLISIWIHMLLGEMDASLGQNYGTHHAFSVIIGYLLMLIIYRFDYSYIGRFGKGIAVLFVVSVIFILNFGININGARAWIEIGGLGRVSLIYLMYLFIPIYGALLYRYRGKGYKGVGMCILWMFIPAWLACRIPCTGLAVVLFNIMAVMLSVAVGKNWFRIHKGRFLAAFWSIILLLPIGAIYLACQTGYLASYRSVRIKSFLNGNTNGEIYDYGRQLAIDFMRNSHWMGKSGQEMVGVVPDINNDYLLLFLASHYGVAAVVLVGLLLLVVVTRMVHIAFGQRNQLGMIIGCGCGILLEGVTIVAVMRNCGLIPSMQTFLPFFTSGGTGVIVSYILAGIVLSIHRYRNILPENA